MILFEKKLSESYSWFGFVEREIVCIVESCVVDHRGDDQVDVDPEGVVEDESDEGKKCEDVPNWQP